MGRKKAAAKKETVSSFDDIITCLAGILVLMIISVTMDLKPPVIFTPTPIDRQSTDKQPIYIECTAKGEMNLVDVGGLRRQAESEIARIAAAHAGDQMKILSEIGKAGVTNEYYKIDLPALMATQTSVLYPLNKAAGLSLPSKIDDITDDNWLARLYHGMDTNKSYVVFLVRSEDASYEIFRRARAFAWLKTIPVAYELFDNNDPFKFGGSGSLPGVQ